MGLGFAPGWPEGYPACPGLPWPPLRPPPSRPCSPCLLVLVPGTRGPYIHIGERLGMDILLFTDL